MSEKGDTMGQFNERGELIPDNTPVEIPVGFGHPEPLEQMIARLVRLESGRAAETGLESFEESDDFETGDDDGLVSPYEVQPMVEEAPHMAKTLEPPAETRTMPEKTMPESEYNEWQAFQAWKQARDQAQKKSSEASSTPQAQ